MNDTTPIEVDTPPAANKIAQASAIAQRMRAEIGKALIGQTHTVDQVLIALFAGGHVLNEAYPALAKPCWCGRWQKPLTARLRVSSSRPT